MFSNDILSFLTPIARALQRNSHCDTMMLSRGTPAARFVCRSCTRRLGQQQPAPRWFASVTGATTAAPLNPDDIYDVVCVGGGPAGLSLLTALRANPVTAGLRLALVEAQDLDGLRAWAPAPDEFSNRCSSLTPASARFLAHIGAWAHVRRERVQSYQAMQVWDGVTGARLAFDWPPGVAKEDLTAADAAAEASGPRSTIAYMVENVNLTSGLLQRLDALGGVDTFARTRVEHIGYGGTDEENGGWDLSGWPAVQLAGAHQRTLLARLLIGADGANSPVRSFADIEARGWDYGRHGVVATLHLEEGAGSLSGDAFKTAYQRFLPTGPVALLPLPGRRATLVWSTTPERAALLRSLAPADFVAMVNAAFRLRPVDLTYLHAQTGGGQADEVAWRLDAGGSHLSENLPAPIVGVQPGTVAAFPLRLRHADTYAGERVALVGDAAHTTHPLAGQGLNAGQGDVASLARALADAVAHGQDIGSTSALAPYPAERYAANHVILGVVDKLHKLYAVQSGPLVPLRSWGLQAVNALRPLKSFLMNQAAGDGVKL